MPVEYLKQLIGFDTTSRNSNLELLDWVEAELAPLGARFVRTPNDAGDKANLFATLGESRAPGLVLSGHTDVVPVDGQEWHSDPFRAEVRDGRLYGRGSSDMKGFLAACMAQARNIAEADLPLPVHFAFSYDEEVGCVGVPSLLEDMARRNITPQFCLVGEPTGMRLVRSHKGILMHHCRVRGRAAHSSLVHAGVNALDAAVRVICHAHDMSERFNREGPHDEAFDTPHTSIHCGVLNAGTVNNIIPHDCRFDLEIRNLPGQDAEALMAQIERYADTDLLPKMQAVAPDSGFAWERTAYFPELDTPADEPWIARMQRLLGDDATPGKVSYGTEAGLFQQAGITCAVCGPGHIAQAHKPDEFVDIAQLEAAEQLIEKLVDDLRGG